jgi:hypothetical protein
MSTVAAWKAFAPDGVTPSTQLSIAVDATLSRPGSSASASALVTASTVSADNLLRGSFTAIDLTNYDELRLSFNASRAAAPGAQTPFFLEIRLGGAALSVTDPSNTWHRYFPVDQVNAWDTIRLSLDDLASAVRSSMSVIQLRVVDASTGFTCHVQDVIAVRDEMLGDIDQALHSRLDARVSLSGTPVPAVLHPANGTLSTAPPYIEIMHFDTYFSRERTQSARPRGDYTDTGYSIRPPSNAYDVFYQIRAAANDRASQSKMLEFVLRTIPPRGEIFVANYPLQIESVFVTPLDWVGGFRTDEVPIFYRIQTRQEVGASTRVTSVRSVVVTTDALNG